MIIVLCGYLLHKFNKHFYQYSLLFKNDWFHNSNNYILQPVKNTNCIIVPILCMAVIHQNTYLMKMHANYYFENLYNNFSIILDYKTRTDLTKITN